MAALSPGTANINTVDVVAVQRHFLAIAPLPAGCPRTAADVNGDASINTSDVIAIQRFALALSTGIANTGKHQFSPASRSYAPLTNNQTGQNLRCDGFWRCCFRVRPLIVSHDSPLTVLYKEKR